MAAFQTYDAVGIKEDVSDVITRISPTKTPFQTMIGQESIHSTYHEWQEDSLRDVRDNAALEGADATDRDRSPTTMLSNRSQIFEETFRVSGTEDAVAQHGRKRETAYQLVKVGEELKRDREHTMVGLDQDAVAGVKDVTARRMASARKLIHADVTVTVDGGAGAARALTEQDLLDVGELVYSEGAEPNIFMIKPADALIVAGFAASSGRERDFSTGKKVVNAVDLYVSPFGEYKVVLNRFMRTPDAMLLDPEMWQKLVLRDWRREALAKTGDSTRHQVLGEFSLKHKNQRASGLITNLT